MVGEHVKKNSSVNIGLICSIIMFLHFKTGYSEHRGKILIYQVKDVQKEEWYDFRPHHQALHHHVQRVQTAVLNRLPGRVQRVVVELRGNDLLNYYKPIDGKEGFWFKGKPLNCSRDNQEKIIQQMVNRQIGVIKRKKTIESKLMETEDEMTELERRQKEIDAEVKRRVDAYKARLEVPETQEEMNQINATNSSSANVLNLMQN